MSNAGIVIIGAGQAGLQLALSLRQEKYDGPITLLGDEGKLPYQRPPLSKAYLKEGNFEHLLLRSKDVIAAQKIDLFQDAVVKIDPSAKTVTCDSGQVRAYEKLIFATGTRTRKLGLQGQDCANLFEIRTAADSDLLRQKLPNARHLVIIGAGFIGLEVAAVARAMGVAVTVIGSGSRVMPRSVSKECSQHFEDWHQGNGVTLRLGARCLSLQQKDGLIEGVALDDGSVIEGDVFLSAIGVLPNQELAEKAGIEVGNGILVNDLLETSRPDIYAIGDCASFPIFGRRGRIESVQNAIDQAKVLARSLMGQAQSYDKVAWFWSDQGPNKLQIAGLTAKADQVVIKRSEDGRKLTAVCFENKRFIGVETINAPADHIGARNLLAGFWGLNIAAFEACDFDLKAVLKAQQGLAA